MASQRFRREGIAATGLAGLMKEAGLTNGAFYSHFDSKESLVCEMVEHVLAVQNAVFREKTQSGGIEAAIRHYLSMEHLTEPAAGCPSAALVPEIARASTETRHAYVSALEDGIAILAEQFPELDAAEAHGKARTLFSLMLGTLQIARATPDRTVAQSILDQGINGALQFIGRSPPR